MPTYTFTTKNHLECTTDEQEIEADNIREVIVKALYIPSVNLDEIKDEVDDWVESFEPDGDDVWVSEGNEELTYMIELNNC